MTSIMQRHAAPEWLRDLATARARYEELSGWPVLLEIEPRRIVAPVGEVLDAITMPAALGLKVLDELNIMMMPVPVIAEPTGTWWTFLTQPATTTRSDVATELRALKVHLMPSGARAVLPTGADDDGTWRWITKPQHQRNLPPWSAIIAVTRRVASRGAATAG